jgi:hypothetical protein
MEVLRQWSAQGARRTTGVLSSVLGHKLLPEGSGVVSKATSTMKKGCGATALPQSREKGSRAQHSAEMRGKSARSPAKNRSRSTGTQAMNRANRKLLLPHENPAFLSKLASSTNSKSGTPELSKLRSYTLAKQATGYDLARLSTLYAGAGMLKYASATLDTLRHEEDANTFPMPTAKQWIELLEAGRRQRDPAFSMEMMRAIKSWGERIPSKQMQMVLLNTYAENAMAEDALDLYREMARRHGTDVSMKMALLKACIRQRDAPESFVDTVVELLNGEHSMGNEGIEHARGSPLPRRVWSMVLMAYASRQSNTVEKCLSIAESLNPLRGRDLLALLRASREAKDVANGDRVLRMIDDWRRGGRGQGPSQEEQRGNVHECSLVSDKNESNHDDSDDNNIRTIDVSISTEIIRMQLIAGRLEEAMRTFDAVPIAERDLALYNVMIDALAELDGVPLSQRRVFDEAWYEHGLFGRRRRKISRNGKVMHIDLHRLGLQTAELAIDKHLEELRETTVPKAVTIVKVIVGKGTPNPNKTRLCEHVRQLLYDRGVEYREERGVFTFSL